MRRVASIALCVMIAAIAPTVAGAVVEKGTIRVNRGGAGVTLDMSRAQVIARLGAPVYKNQNGYLQYGKVNLFDVYLDVGATPDRVRLIGISGPQFCFPSGFCMMDHGAVGKLKNRYGSKLKVVKLEDGERVYRVSGFYHGCNVFTDFTPLRFRSSSKLIQIFIGFESGSAC
jgi:hypothetical protein